MEDRISALPDPIICHILSFLPTEQAIATSVLSKRWIPLWRAIPILNFNDKNYSQNKETYFRFIQLVYTVMALRGGEQQPIKEFHLICESSLRPSSTTVSKWVVAANQWKTEHISLSLPNMYTGMPLGVFSSTTLVVLKLHGFSVDRLSSVSFPSLKILHLILLRFETCGFLVKFLVEILSACPILEVLVMIALELPDFMEDIVMVAQMPALNLPNLVEVDIALPSVIFPLQSFHNVRLLRADVDEKLIKKSDLSTHNFSNLTSMNLTLFDSCSWNWLIELLHYCPHLQDLEIFQMYPYGSGSPDEEKRVDPPQSVPECLSSALKSFRLGSYQGANCELQFSRFIIQNARVLRKVTICKILLPSPNNLLQKINDLSSCPRGSPTCELYFER